MSLNRIKSTANYTSPMNNQSLAAVNLTKSDTRETSQSKLGQVDTAADLKTDHITSKQFKPISFPDDYETNKNGDTVIFSE